MKTPEQIDLIIAEMKSKQAAALARVADLDVWISAGLLGKDERFVSNVCTEKVEQKGKAEKAAEWVKVLTWIKE